MALASVGMPLPIVAISSNADRKRCSMGVRERMMRWHALMGHMCIREEHEEQKLWPHPRIVSLGCAVHTRHVLLPIK